MAERKRDKETAQHEIHATSVRWTASARFFIDIFVAHLDFFEYIRDRIESLDLYYLIYRYLII